MKKLTLIAALFLAYTSYGQENRKTQKERSHYEDSAYYPILTVWNDTIPCVVLVYMSVNKDTSIYTVQKNSAFEVCRREQRDGCRCWPRYIHLKYLQLNKRVEMCCVKQRLD